MPLNSAGSWSEGTVIWNSICYMIEGRSLGWILLIRVESILMSLSETKRWEYMVYGWVGFGRNWNKGGNPMALLKKPKAWVRNYLKSGTVLILCRLLIRPFHAIVMGWNRWEIVTTTSNLTISSIMNLKNPATEPISGTHCACSHTTPGISFEDMQVNIRVVIML